jgi:hypothetical protein
VADSGGRWSLECYDDCAHLTELSAVDVS